MAQSTNFSIDPKVDCTMTNDGTKLSCKDTVKMLATSDMSSLVIKCQAHNYAVQNTTSALGAAIGLLIIITRSRNSYCVGGLYCHKEKELKSTETKVFNFTKFLINFVLLFAITELYYK